MLATVFLAAPLDKYVLSQWQWAHALGLPTGRIAIFLLAGFLLLSIPALRRHCQRVLRTPIAPERFKELPVALALDVTAMLGAFGAFALMHWAQGGEPALARIMGGPSHAAQWAAAISAGGIVQVLLATTIAPVMEELVFRGLLFAAWQRQMGWVASALLTSLVFGLFHGAVLPQFLASIIFICVLRRTGSLWAPIILHAATNALLWYPLLGQFVLPAGRSTGELHLWTPHLVCLAITLIALPLYLWSARDSGIPSPVDFEQRRLF
ncbi:MAG TPA: CPBP family intramembrane glutamic endopeptidase [Usitatibacter sp.]|nr:CPBP family intramembrane glutamic endopeptidase [Usitatibacter sp.]